MSNKYLIGLKNLAADDKGEVYNLYVVEADSMVQGFMEYRSMFTLGKFEQPEMVKVLPPDTPVGPYTGEKKEEPAKQEEDNKERPKIKSFTIEKDLLKLMAMQSGSEEAVPLLKSWDMPIDEDNHTLGDVITNALDSSIECVCGHFIIINGEQHNLLTDDGFFDIELLRKHDVFGKDVILRCKPKDVSVILYMMTPEVHIRFNEESSKDMLVFKPEDDDLSEGGNVYMSIQDIEGDDITIFKVEE